MAKLMSPVPVVLRRSYFPCICTRIILGLLSAIPFSLQYPHIPSRALSNSNYLYCVSIYGLTLWSSYHLCSYLLDHMQAAKPYNHCQYILSFELLTIQVLNIIPIISWIDTTALTATIDAWYQLIDKYEKVLGKSLPNHKTKEWLLQTTIIVSVPVAAFCGAKLIESELEELIQLKFLPSLLLPSIIGVSLVHHWTGYYFAVESISNELVEHLKQASFEHLLTSKLVEEYKILWRLLRNVLDKINNMRIPLYICAIQCALFTMWIFEGVLLYWQTDNVPVAAFNFGLSGFCLIPMIHCCRAGQNVSKKVELFFEDVISTMKLSSVSGDVQRQICIIYLMKKTRKPEVTLFGYKDLNFRLLLSAFSAVTMYILIMIQFHQMKV